MAQAQKLTYQEASEAVLAVLNRKPRAPGQPGPDVRHDEMMAAIALMKQALDQLAGELAAARAETAAERTMCASLREQIAAEATRAAGALGTISGMRTAEATLVAQLATERAARQAAEGRIEQALAAAAAPSPMEHPMEKETPPTYRVDVGERDANGRMRTLVIKPIDAGTH